MRIRDSISARRNTLLSIALFSCIQITLGFFLITGQGSDSVQPIQSAQLTHKTFAFKNINNTDFLSENLKNDLKLASMNTRPTPTD